MPRSNKPKLALLVNMVAPYRVRLFEYLASGFDLVILCGGLEANRASWTHAKVEGARVRRVLGWQVALPKRRADKVFDKWFLHIEPGYFTDLIREHPEAVISAEMGLRTLAALLYGSLSRTPVWIWWGGTLRTEQHLGRGKRLLRKVIARWAKHWISYGRTSTEYLLSLGIDRGRILQIQNCVDESWYRSIETHRLDIEPRPVLLHVGQMIPRKGISEFLRAAAHVQEEGLDFSIVLVGSGPDREQLERLVEQLHLRNVRFYGAQPPHAVASFYRSAEVLVFPTMEDVWGLVANEGVLSGMRVLCSKHAGCAPELFDQEATFDPENEAEFVVALRRAVTGQLPQPDPTRLLPARQVAQMIISEIYSSLKAPAAGWQPRPDPQM